MSNMKQALLGLVCLFVSCGSLSWEPPWNPTWESLLPEDFFVAEVGKVSDTTKINPGMSLFEVVQHFPKRTRESAEHLDNMTYCIASTLAAMRDAKGWSWIVIDGNGVDDTGRVINVAPFDSEEDAKKYLPGYSHWLPYKTTAEYRPMCSHLVNPKYLWPEGGSGAPKAATPLPDDVGEAERDYPIVNAHAKHQLTLFGALPTSQPIDDVELLYETDIQGDNPDAAQCRVTSSYLPPGPRWHRVLLPLTRNGDKYRAVFFVDQFLPGRCLWHFKMVTYRMHMTGFAEPMRIQRGVIAEDADWYARHSEYLRTLPDGGARMDLWCLNPPRYIPISCTDFGDGAVYKLSPQQQASVPAIERENPNAAYVLPGATSVQVNFHDISAVSTAAASR